MACGACYVPRDRVCEGQHSSQGLPGWGRTQGAASCLGLGSSKAAELVTLWSPRTETSAESSRSRAVTYLQAGEGSACFQQRSGHRPLETDHEPTVWGEGVRVQLPSPGLFVPGSRQTSDDSISPPVSLPFLGQKGLPCAFLCNQGEGRTNQILGTHLIKTFCSGYSVCLDTTDGIIASGWQVLSRQESFIEAVCSNKHAADFTFWLL